MISRITTINKNNRIWLAFSTNHNDNGSSSSSQNVAINGNALEDNSLNYSISETYGNKGQQDSGSLNVSMRTRFIELGTGYNYSIALSSLIIICVTELLPIVDGLTNLNYKARYYQKDAAIIAGRADATVGFTVTYY